MLARVHIIAPVANSLAADRVDSWVEALLDRHLRGLTTAEFLRAVRALSARYVERRVDLPSRSPIDSAGKRAAFAAFYAPLHFFTARAVVAALDAASPPLDTVLDLGCGTGVSSAAWALAFDVPPVLTGSDQHGWSLEEAAWNWRTLGLRGRTRREDMVKASAPPRAGSHSRRPSRSGVLLAWSVNELTRPHRDLLRPRLLDQHQQGASVLVIEPLSRSAVPWWNEWADSVLTAGGRVDEWKFDVVLPPRLAALDAAAGFRRQALGARSLWLPGASGEPERRFERP